MTLDLIRDQASALWADHGLALLIGLGVIVVALVILSVFKIIRSRQRDRWIDGLAALVVLAWTSEGLWEVAYFTLGVPLGFSIMTFIVFEALMVSSALQAEQHRRRHPSPGPAGYFVWALAAATATVVALDATTLVEAVLRFTLPLAAAGRWWAGITAEREDDPPEVRQQREQARRRREATWGLTRRRALVALGVMRPGAETVHEAERERRIRRMVSAAVRLYSAEPESWRGRRARRRLCNLARLATAHDITAVRARVDRATRVAELVLPRGSTPTRRSDEAPAPSLAKRGGNGHRWRPGPHTAQRGVAFPGAELDSPGPSAAGRTDESRSGIDDVMAMSSPSALGATGQNPGPLDGASSKQQPDRRTRGAGEPAGQLFQDLAAERYRQSALAGESLTCTQLATQLGCSKTTAWRGIRAVKVGARQHGNPTDAIRT